MKPNLIGHSGAGCRMGHLESAGRVTISARQFGIPPQRNGKTHRHQFERGLAHCQPPFLLKIVIAEHIEVSGSCHGYPRIMAIFKFTFDAGLVPLGFRHIVMARAVDPVSEAKMRVQSA